jgi:hypothetical protein
MIRQLLTEFPYGLCIRSVHYRVHKSPQLDYVLWQIDPLHNAISESFKGVSNI